MDIDLWAKGDFNISKAVINKLWEEMETWRQRLETQNLLVTEGHVFPQNG